MHNNQQSISKSICNAPKTGYCFQITVITNYSTLVHDTKPTINIFHKRTKDFKLLAHKSGKQESSHAKFSSTMKQYSILVLRFYVQYVPYLRQDIAHNLLYEISVLYTRMTDLSHQSGALENRQFNNIGCPKWYAFRRSAQRVPQTGPAVPRLHRRTPVTSPCLCLSQEFQALRVQHNTEFESH